MADKVVWLDRGWQTVFIGFCPSEVAWRREMRQFQCSEPYPTAPGRATRFEKDAKVCVIVTLGPQSVERDRVEVAGLLCHEATHVWQTVRAVMGEREPSVEFEAYSMQAIFQSLYQAWLDTRAPAEAEAAPKEDA